MGRDAFLTCHAALCCAADKQHHVRFVLFLCLANSVYWFDATKIKKNLLSPSIINKVFFHDLFRFAELYITSTPFLLISTFSVTFSPAFTFKLQHFTKNIHFTSLQKVYISSTFAFFLSQRETITFYCHSSFCLFKFSGFFVSECHKKLFSSILILSLLIYK